MDDRTWRQGLTGAVFIAAGILLLGSQAGWWSLGSFVRWWPLGLVAIGVERGLRTRDGFIWVGWGVLLLSWSTHLWSWRETWPLLLVLYGVALVVWPSGGRRVRRDGSRVR